MARKFNIKNFDQGVINRIEDYSIPENASSNSLNWLTRGDKIELSGVILFLEMNQVGLEK